jgi:hypothetical protein
VAGSGVTDAEPPPAVAEPMVMLSNATWFSVPPKSTEWAVPLNVTPIGKNGQNPVSQPGPPEGVTGKDERRKDAPRFIQPAVDVDEAGIVDGRVVKRKAGRESACVIQRRGSAVQEEQGCHAGGREVEITGATYIGGDNSQGIRRKGDSEIPAGTAVVVIADARKGGDALERQTCACAATSNAASAAAAISDRSFICSPQVIGMPSEFARTDQTFAALQHQARQ